jgi:hypothetical protein
VRAANEQDQNETCRLGRIAELGNGAHAVLKMFGLRRRDLADRTPAGGWAARLDAPVHVRLGDAEQCRGVR